MGACRRRPPCRRPPCCPTVLVLTLAGGVVHLPAPLCVQVRKQLEAMFEKQGMGGMSPEMMKMMQGMDTDKVNAQFAELGMKPEDIVSKVMADPELATGFTNPKVQAAIMDISSNPMNIVKYQGDAEVMKVLEKVTEVFGPQMQAAQARAQQGEGQ